jgi:hypothetical protein
MPLQNLCHQIARLALMALKQNADGSLKNEAEGRVAELPLLIQEGAKREPDRAKPQMNVREIKKDAAKPPLMERTVVRHEERITKYFGNPNHPVCAAAVASHLFLDGEATPP